MLDTDVLTLIALFGAWLVFFILGAEVKSYFAIMSGLAGVYLTFELFTLTGNVPVAVLWGAIAVFTLLLGIVGAAKETERSG